MFLLRLNSDGRPIARRYALEPPPSCTPQEFVDRLESKQLWVFVRLSDPNDPPYLYVSKREKNQPRLLPKLDMKLYPVARSAVGRGSSGNG